MKGWGDEEGGRGRQRASRAAREKGREGKAVLAASEAALDSGRRRKGGALHSTPTVPASINRPGRERRGSLALRTDENEVERGPPNTNVEQLQRIRIRRGLGSNEYQHEVEGKKGGEGRTDGKEAMERAQEEERKAGKPETKGVVRCRRCDRAARWRRCAVRPDAGDMLRCPAPAACCAVPARVHRPLRGPPCPSGTMQHPGGPVRVPFGDGSTSALRGTGAAHKYHDGVFARRRAGVHETDQNAVRGTHSASTRGLEKMPRVPRTAAALRRHCCGIA
ncbi:hypothetical protein FB451DRAFT_1184132 [Mycena latifolia]|nr:hypothetical protein FB451DRAFT_1184132 [Mycena latifolia]